nr:HupE/UreJ family protein [Chelatococcus sp. YT9]
MELVPQAAQAHGALEGVGDFYAGLLHPFVAPAEALAIVATGLLMGRSGLAACRYGIVAFGSALAAGLAFGSMIDPGSDRTTLLALLASIMAAVVITGLRAPLWIGATLAVLAGVVVGIDATPSRTTPSGILLTGLATLLAGTALITMAAGLALRAAQHWQRVAVQVAGSWIAASAILLLAYQLVGFHR